MRSFSRGRGTGSLADGLDRLIASLDASFGAAIARQEEEAASDLAFSLAQDRDMLSAAARVAPLELVMQDGDFHPVTRIGSDYFGAGDPLSVLVPSHRALLQEGSARGEVVTSSERMLNVLLRWARRGSVVEVSTGHARVRGRLTRAGRDHIEVLGPRGRYIVARGEVCCVRRVLEGSTDAS
jgi:hypothetical protein